MTSGDSLGGGSEFPVIDCACAAARFAVTNHRRGPSVTTSSITVRHGLSDHVTDCVVCTVAASEMSKTTTAKVCLVSTNAVKGSEVTTA